MMLTGVKEADRNDWYRQRVSIMCTVVCSEFSPCLLRGLSHLLFGMQLGLFEYGIACLDSKHS